MRRETKGKSVKPIGLADESKIIQKRSSDYTTRYKGMVADEKKIVEKGTTSYKGSRYN